MFWTNNCTFEVILSLLADGPPTLPEMYICLTTDHNANGCNSHLSHRCVLYYVLFSSLLFLSFFIYPGNCLSIGAVQEEE